VEEAAVAAPSPVGADGRSGTRRSESSRHSDLLAEADGLDRTATSAGYRLEGRFIVDRPALRLVDLLGDLSRAQTSGADT